MYSSWGHKYGSRFDSYRKDYFNFQAMNQLTQEGYEMYANVLQA